MIDSECKRGGVIAACGYSTALWRTCNPLSLLAVSQPLDTSYSIQ